MMELLANNFPICARPARKCEDQPPRRAQQEIALLIDFEVTNFDEYKKQLWREAAGFCEYQWQHDYIMDSRGGPTGTLQLRAKPEANLEEVLARLLGDGLEQHVPRLRWARVQEARARDHLGAAEGASSTLRARGIADGRHVQVVVVLDMKAVKEACRIPLTETRDSWFFDKRPRR